MVRGARRTGGRPTRLPVAPAAATARLSAADGDPIWPVANDATLAALTRLAALFDATLVAAEPQPGRPAARSRHGQTVVSAAPEADAAAALYAHLTGRRFLPAAQPARAAHQRPDVVVAPTRLLTPPFLAALHGDPDRAPGLIAAASPSALLRQALLRAAALRLCGGPARRSVEVMHHFAISRAEMEGRELFGNQAPREELRHVLGRGSEVLSIFTVGDGIDAALGPLILCPIAGGSSRPAPGPPPCVVSDTCHRLQLPLAEAAASRGLVAPEALVARVLLLHACWGIQPSGSLHGQDWGYGWRLAVSDRLGAIVTTWQITLGAPADTGGLARMLARGTPLGTAVARFNHGKQARRTGQLLCLLGDPDFRLRPGPLRVSGLRATSDRPRPPAGERRQLAFLSAYLEATEPKPASQAAQETARISVGMCQRLAWRGLAIDAPGETAGAVMRAAMLDFLCAHGTIPAYHWMALGHPERSAASDSGCLVCGQPDSEVTLRLRVEGAERRLLTLCPRCGLTEDRPVSAARLGLAVDGRMVCLQRPPAPGRGAAALLFRPLAAPAYARRWDAGAAGRPVPVMPVFDGDGPSEAGQLLVFAMEGAALQVGRTPYVPRLKGAAGPALGG